MRTMRTLWAALFAASLLVTLQCGEDKGPGPSPEQLVVTPDSVTLAASSSQEFVATYGSETPLVDWYVEGIQGGTPGKGMITPEGLYTGPHAVPPGGYVTLRARAVADTTLEGSAWITIVLPQDEPYVVVSPETAPASPGDTVDFSAIVSYCDPDSVIWSVIPVWGDPVSVGGISPRGKYVAPATTDMDFAVLVKATSLTCPEKAGIARVTVYAPAREFSIEMEDFTESHNIGGFSIIGGECNGASGGKAVDGMDREGEWIKVPVRIPVSGAYQAFLQYQAGVGDTMEVSIEIVGCGSPDPSAVFDVDHGAEIG
ncbi:MAG: hypothetical protein V1694_07730 [Candidatus Eisenbacteria bacterium]